ncbi:MAG: VapC toxin family PIN domain ribonuclease, partial [Pseudorhizobium sp.]
MFLDASAVVAIMTGENGADDLIARVTTSRHPIHYSSTTVFETVIAIARKMAVNRYGDQKPTPPDFIKRSQENVEIFLRSIHAIEVDLSAGLHK